MRIRLVLSFVLVVLVSIAGVVYLARRNAANEVRAFMYRGGMTGTSGLAASLESYYAENGSWDGVESLLSMPGHGRQGGGQGQGQGNSQGQAGGMMGGMMGQRLRLADSDGSMLYDSSGAGAGADLSRSELSGAIALKNGGRTVGYLLAQGGMGYTQAEESFLLNRLSQAALTAGLIAGGVALLLALLLAYSLMRPVRAMTLAAESLGRGDLSQRVRVHGNDELATLGRTFNQMAGSLQQSQESRRAMTADIAHELRTPLAVQRAHLEALQDGVYPLTTENLAPILEQNVLLTRLVDDLRTLALADAGQLKLECVPTDLASLLERSVERFRPQAAARQVALDLNTSVLPIPLMTLDPMRIEQIIGNLLSNALRYTPEGGLIRVSLERSAAGARIQVHDSGPGIPPESLPHIFDRFYRADRSRSRMEGGSGLGLAIARQLAQAHGGLLEAANHPQGGAVFTFELPLTVQGAVGVA